MHVHDFVCCVLATPQYMQRMLNLIEHARVVLNWAKNISEINNSLLLLQVLVIRKIMFATKFGKQKYEMMPRHLDWGERNASMVSKYSIRNRSH